MGAPVESQAWIWVAAAKCRHSRGSDRVNGGRRCRGRRNLRVTLAFSINSCSYATPSEWQVSESNGMKVFGDALRTELHG